MRKWVITCEHAGNDVPDKFCYLFGGQKEVLNTHRAVDLGSRSAFEVLKTKADHAEIHIVTRLLIELNRSLHHPGLFSEFSKKLKKGEKQYLIKEYYLPYRKRIENKIESFISSGNDVVHISVHSFTPILNGLVRNTDIGLLYDPARKSEKNFCESWKENIQRKHKEIKVRFNYPYLGKADGFTTALRKLFPDHYIGIELEINQKYGSTMNNIASILLRCLP